MFMKVFGLYLQGLVLALICVLFFSFCWGLWRARKKMDKTLKERQSFLYDLLMIVLITTPVLSFAFMAILLIIKSRN